MCLNGLGSSHHIRMNMEIVGVFSLLSDVEVHRIRNVPL
jgi:hypothetical protein